MEVNINIQIVQFKIIMGAPQQSRETGPGSIPDQGTKIPQAAE